VRPESTHVVPAVAFAYGSLVMMSVTPSWSMSSSSDTAQPK
jgi:hypothetical protein